MVIFAACSTTSVKTEKSEPVSVEKSRKVTLEEIPAPSLPTFTTQWETRVLSGSPIVLRAFWGEMSGFGIELLRDSQIYGHFIDELSLQEPERTYPGTEFQSLMWNDSIRVGQTFDIDPIKLKPFLTQFHHDVITDLNMDATGAYGILQAAGPDYYSLFFRLHAQFRVAEIIYLTPAQFDGRLLVNRKSGDIVEFEIEVPTEHLKNVAFEVHDHDGLTGLGQIDEMSLRAEGHQLAEPDWTEQIEPKLARDILADTFFACRKIDWVPLKEAVKTSEESGKPLFVLAIAGVLDDQSC